MDISNPQYRESIIAMDGEIVRPRVRTIAQAAALTPRANVLAFKDESVDEYYFPRGLVEHNNDLIVPAVFEVGDWDMDADGTVTIGLPVVHDLVIAIGGCVRKDDDSARYGIPYLSRTTDLTELYCTWSNADTVTLLRRTGGFFDTVNFDLTPFNRGWVVIWYVP